MTNTDQKDEIRPRRQRKNARSVEQRENQMIALAVDLAEKQLIEGTASSQVITHYLKLGSTKERLEKEIMAKQKDLLEAKTEAIQSAKRQEELLTEAIRAFTLYRGETVDDSDLHRTP